MLLYVYTISPRRLQYKCQVECNNHGKRLYMIHYRNPNTVCPNFQLSEFFDFAVGNLKKYSNTNSIMY